MRSKRQGVAGDCRDDSGRGGQAVAHLRAQGAALGAGGTGRGCTRGAKMGGYEGARARAPVLEYRHLFGHRRRRGQDGL
jgi:hypothetical protein